MLKTFGKLGFFALFAGLALAVAPARAGSVTFNIDGGNTLSLTPYVTYDSVLISGFGSYDGLFDVDGGRIQLTNPLLGELTFSATGPSPFSIVGTIVDLTLTGLTTGYGEIAFASPPFASQFGSFTYDIDYNWRLRPDGGTFTLTSAAVPEPSAFAMGATGLVGLLAARRRLARRPA
jgi:hypothetical protein